MVDRLQQRHLEAVAGVEHAEAAVAEAGRPIGGGVGERRQEVAGAGAADPPRGRHQVEPADGLHEARVGLLLCRQQQRSAEHTSELKSLMRISYAVLWLK